MSGLAIVPDLRVAIKSLVRTPGFTLIAIVTLGLGIGANTAAFSVINEVLLRPLPYPDPGHVDRIYRTTPQNSRGAVAPADYLQFERERSGYGEVAGYAFADLNLSAPGEPAEMVRGLRISANFFSILGVQPERGRVFRPDETGSGHHRLLILSYRLWQNRFAGDPHVIGRTVRVDGEVHEIVGVLPAALNDWRHLGPFDLFQPLALTDKESTDRASTWVRLMGRRSPALSHAQAEEFIAGFGRRLLREFPVENAGSVWRSMPIDTAVAPDNARGVFAMLIGLSGFVLLIACSNLANLLLARTMARAREFALRAALGASRLRLLRPLLAESILLALAGGLFAIYVATWTDDWLRHYMEVSAYATGDAGVFTLDRRILGWALGAGLLTIFVFAVAPALFALRLDPNQTLKSGGRGMTGDRAHRRFRHALIVGQFALALVLLAGAAVFARGVQDTNRRHYGWESERLVTAAIALPAAAYPGPREIAEFERLALQRLAALPGVASASMSYSMPFFGLAEPRKYVVGGREAPPPGMEPVAVTNGVSPGYFETLGTRVLAGRAFDAGDALTSPKVFVINEAMARGLFGTESPLGRRLARAGRTVEWGVVVGVVNDIQSVVPDRLPVAYQVYQPLAQEPRAFNEIAVRTTGLAPASLVDSVRATLSSLDPDLPARELQPADATIATVKYQWHVVGAILTFLAVIGVGLAALGIYGVVARTMAQRTSEFGIRIALGAQVADITRLVLGFGARLAVVGSVLGLLGAFGVTRLIAFLFPGLQTNSAAILAGVTLLLVAVAQAACYLPARAAARISPTEALRAE